jgi:4-hydroxy-tetrahydrodipicolinate synthase
MLSGSMVALVTPMNRDGSINKKSLSDLVEWHIASGTEALAVTGTTGESATLTDDEKYDLINEVVTQVAKRIPVIAGTGTYSTRHTVELTHNAKAAGADAALIITPYCIKPSQNGLYAHYKTVAETVNLPIILYNVPGRTACDLLPETIKRLSKIDNIIGIKEATGNPERAQEIKQLCDKNFAVYSGDDATSLQFMLNGAKGVISVTANVVPRKMHDFCKAALTGNISLAEKLNAELMPLHQKLFVETNPVPTKWALHQMGLIPEGIRLPLLPLDSRYQEEVREAMDQAGTLPKKEKV